MCLHHPSGGKKQDVYYQLTCHCQNSKMHAFSPCLVSPHHSVQIRKPQRSHQLLPLKEVVITQTSFFGLQSFFSLAAVTFFSFLYSASFFFFLFFPFFSTLKRLEEESVHDKQPHILTFTPIGKEDIDCLVRGQFPLLAVHAKLS